MSDSNHDNSERLKLLNQEIERLEAEYRELLIEFPKSLQRVTLADPGAVDAVFKKELRGRRAVIRRLVEERATLQGESPEIALLQWRGRWEQYYPLRPAEHEALKTLEAGGTPDLEGLRALGLFRDDEDAEP